MGRGQGEVLRAATAGMGSGKGKRFGGKLHFAFPEPSPHVSWQ